MNNTDSLLLIFALVITCLVLLLIGIIALYLKLIAKFDELKHGREKPVVNPEVLVAQARVRSTQLLEEAHQKAVNIVGSAEAYVKREDGIIQKELERAEAEYSKVYKEVIQASGTKAQTMIQSIPQDIKIILISAIDNFRVSLTAEIGKAQEEANKAIREAYQTAADEVNKYKEDRMKQVDSAILEIIKEVTEKVLAKSVSIEEHEKLVQKSLEEAKRQKIF